MIQTIWKNGTKITHYSNLNGLNQEKSDFEDLHKVTVMRHCLHGVSKREVTKYQQAVLFS
jgi:hypothetical protein